jgi:hypothetical protein
VCLNTLQIWIIDEFLRSKTRAPNEQAFTKHSLDIKNKFKDEPQQETTPLLPHQGDFNKYLEDPPEDDGYIKDLGSSFMDQSINLTATMQNPSLQVKGPQE